jgi:hypothetical protein
MSQFEKSNDKEMEGDKPVIDNTIITNFMAEMRKNMETLSASVAELQTGKKRKADDDCCPGPSKVPDIHVSDISSDEDQADDFEELINDTVKEDDFDNDAMLDELADCFGTDEKCSAPILDKLAKVANDGVRAIVSGDKIKEVTNKYCRPKNVGNLVTPKLNEEFRSHLSRFVRNRDARFQRTQALVGKAMVPLLQQIDILMKNKQKGETPSTKDITVLAMDGLKMMTYVYCDLSNRRRELIIQPDKNEEYRSLCAIEHPVTENLFGDDLGKKVEDITKANKIGSKLSGNTRAERRYPGSRKHYQGQRPNYNSGYKSQSFLGQRNNYQHFKKKPFSKQMKK